MAILSVSEASRQWRVGRTNLYRAVKSGRLNLSARPDGSRGIDTSELVRVFGEPSNRTTANVPLLSSTNLTVTELDDREQERTPSPVVLLQNQVNQLSIQLEQANKQGVRLLALLENEQHARRELETKLLPAPRPTGRVRPWVLLALLLVAVLAFVGWHFRAIIVSALAS